MQIELLTTKYHIEMPNLRHQIEARARQMEGRDLGQQAATPAGKPDAQKYDRSRQGAAAGLASEAKVYNADADVTATAGKEEKKKVGSTFLTEPSVCSFRQLRCLESRIGASWLAA